MIQLLLTAMIALPIIFYLDKKREGIIEGFTVAAFVVVPGLILILLTIAFGFFGIPLWILYPLQLLYFIFPLFMTRYQIEYNWGVSIAFGSIVFFAHVLTSIAFIYLMADK